MQAYILLFPKIYLQKSGKELVQTCQYLVNLMNDIGTEGVVIICKLFITMIKAHPEFAIELLQLSMIEIVRNFLGGDSNPSSINQIYMQVIARYFLANQQALSPVLGKVHIENSLQKLLTIWFNTMPSVTHTEDKKWLAIMLCNMLTIPNDFLIDKFSVVVVYVYETIGDLFSHCSAEEVCNCHANFFLRFYGLNVVNRCSGTWNQVAFTK